MSISFAWAFLSCLALSAAYQCPQSRSLDCEAAGISGSVVIRGLNYSLSDCTLRRCHSLIFEDQAHVSLTNVTFLDPKGPGPLIHVKGGSLTARDIQMETFGIALDQANGDIGNLKAWHLIGTAIDSFGSVLFAKGMHFRNCTGVCFLSVSTNAHVADILVEGSLTSIVGVGIHAQ